MSHCHRWLTALHFYLSFSFKIPALIRSASSILRLTGSDMVYSIIFSKIIETVRKKAHHRKNTNLGLKNFFRICISDFLLFSSQFMPGLASKFFYWITLIVSKGWPVRTQATPPTVPEMKLFVFSLIFRNFYFSDSYDFSGKFWSPNLSQTRSTVP